MRNKKPEMELLIKIKPYKMENSSYFRRDAVEEVHVPVMIEDIEAEVVENIETPEEEPVTLEFPENYY